MTVSTVTIRAPFSGFASSDLRPHCNVEWAGGVGDFDVLYEWDTVNTFDSGNLITDTNTGVSASPDEGTPPSDMGGGTWYVRVTVTDNDDSNDTQSSIHTILELDPDAENRYLYVNNNIGVDFSEGGADGDPREFSRYLYVNNYIVSTVPVPFIESISPTLAEAGDSITIRGQGFDNVARDWSAEARLYDDPDPLVGSYTLMTETDFTAGNEEDVLVVTVPAGSTGWVIVVNDDGL